MTQSPIKIELSAVIVAVSDDGQPKVLIDPHLALPSGPFETEHRTLEQGLRAWAQSKGGQTLNFIEQLYTFADRDRTEGGLRTVSISYLALSRATETSEDALWSPWYKYFPWEDHRDGIPVCVTKVILPHLLDWKKQAADSRQQKARAHRIAVAFPKDAKLWNEELVLQRYELLWEAGLVAEARKSTAKQAPGAALAQDHRRILATAIARLRAKIKYRPVVFELLPENFTLLRLQETVEALAGIRLHKQNFRRLVETQGLVEETNLYATATGGRPAKLFAFRHEVLEERAVIGTKLPRSA